MAAETTESEETKVGATEANPFSFKIFLSRRATEGSVSGPVEAGSRRQPTGVRGERGKKVGGKKKGPASGTGNEDLPFPELGGTEEGEESNPFSFKKFVKRKQAQKPQVKDQDEEDSSSESEDDESLLHPLVADSALKLPAQPSLKRTKDDIKIDPARTKVKPKTQAKLFPDSESDGSSDNDSSLLTPNLGQSKGTLSVGGITDPLGMLNTPDPLGLVPPATVGKERKLSHRSDSNSSFESLRLDGDVVGEAELLPYVPGMAETESAELRKEIKKLRAENERMRRALEGSQQETKQEKERNKTLKKQIKVLKKKEAADTKALEDMVQKVEQNLVATTKRATSAEATIMKLKQEVQNLQAELARVNPQTMQQHYEEILMGVRDKASFASQRLAIAAHAADQSIRDLLSGVDTLKNIAEILEFIDRISEIKQ